MRPTPWDLHGDGLLVASGWLLPVDDVAPHVPEPLEIVRVLPGRTLGGLFVSRFDLGSEAEYNELLFVPALTRHADELGFFVERIYVDNPLVMSSIVEAAGIDRQTADFRWDAGAGSVEVTQAGQPVCAMRWSSQPFFLFRTSFTLPALGIANGRVVEFQGELDGRIGFVRADVNVPADGPLNLMAERGPLWSLCLDDWQVRLFDPHAVEELKAEQQQWTGIDWEPI